MALSKEEVLHIARLSRLRIEEEDIAEYQEKLSTILDYVAKLQTLDTTGVAELQHAAEISNVFRADEVEGCDEDVRTRSIENFSNREGDLLKVQAVFENRTE
ncbi:Asp-tRNA(Asn)/Glu-tRNA(Gln) amidotransferase subunit GatC [Candidatus Uhrbacteria bacterium]|jgi:aspartyl-tRNA(Asn)/glutamyl-tRNA(Gln) amidotransferase subunit C|nr:Asp-tRNA(Asn)/Glu-tRNA(Gln) amidotransferase subunit GatC [Candidatus Uhrbacteria bacterium]